MDGSADKENCYGVNGRKNVGECDKHRNASYGNSGSQPVSYRSDISQEPSRAGSM